MHASLLLLLYETFCLETSRAAPAVISMILLLSEIPDILTHQVELKTMNFSEGSQGESYRSPMGIQYLFLPQFHRPEVYLLFYPLLHHYTFCFQDVRICADIQCAARYKSPPSQYLKQHYSSSPTLPYM